jgi:uncharacterized membrane protein
MRRLAHIHHKTNKFNEPLWHVQVAILVVVFLQLILDSRLSFGPKYLLAGIELFLLFTLMIVAQSAVSLKLRRTFAILLIALVTIGNFVSLLLVIASLLNDSQAFSGTGLLVSAFSIFITNIIVFGLWYWEMDFRRSDTPQDFLFPQDNMKKEIEWSPSFIDYLYLAFVNGTSFSGTDSVALTPRAKSLMAIQALISLVIVVLVTARAVSIIS